MQEGFSAIPGSKNPAHIKENIDIFDFELSDGEMAKMRSLNKDKRFFNMTLEQLDRMATRRF
ncbi:MAG: aldo/keto reductase, partial [Bacteroidales bacterium]|jgi:diketogulonate reductase-like aldo/keto reductase|nr:aldo/keto reductase [Bacteroidales bacterium]